jgi:hypothetical protein
VPMAIAERAGTPNLKGRTTGDQRPPCSFADYPRMGVGNKYQLKSYVYKT